MSNPVMEPETNQENITTAEKSAVVNESNETITEGDTTKTEEELIDEGYYKFDPLEDINDDILSLDKNVKFVAKNVDHLIDQLNSYSRVVTWKLRLLFALDVIAFIIIFVKVF